MTSIVLQPLLARGTVELLDGWRGPVVHEGHQCVVVSCSSHTAHLFDLGSSSRVVVFSDFHGLDPDDDRTLPDGSRFVDAVALLLSAELT